MDDHYGPAHHWRFWSRPGFYWRHGTDRRPGIRFVGARPQSKGFFRAASSGLFDSAVDLLPASHALALLAANGGDVCPRCVWLLSVGPRPLPVAVEQRG